MSSTMPEETFKERICFLVKDRVVIGERAVPGDGPGDPARIIYSCARSSDCEKLKLPCKILNQNLANYPFELKLSLKLKREGSSAHSVPLPWKRRLGPQ